MCILLHITAFYGPKLPNILRFTGPKGPFLMYLQTNGIVHDNSIAYIDTWIGCPLECFHCRSKYVSVHDIRPLSVAELTVPLSTIPNLQQVWTYGHGEPMLNPYIKDIVNEINNMGLKVRLSTIGLPDLDYSWLGNNDLEFNLMWRTIGSDSAENILKRDYGRIIYVRLRKDSPWVQYIMPERHIVEYVEVT
jgi:hypothetical protein